MSACFVESLRVFPARLLILLILGLFPPHCIVLYAVMTLLVAHVESKEPWVVLGASSDDCTSRIIGEGGGIDLKLKCALAAGRYIYRPVRWPCGTPRQAGDP